MATLAGWLTGEQVPQETIEQVLLRMGAVLEQRGGERALALQPGAGLIAFSDTAHSMRQNTEPALLDWVPARRTMVYRRPLSGLHTLYYLENWPAHGNLLFASEIKALFAAGAPRRLYLPALDALLHYGFIPAPWTAFQDIHVVPAGSLLRWQRAKIVVNSAHDYDLDEPLIPGAGFLEELSTQLSTITTNLLPLHTQLVALSSGGNASALVTALARQQVTESFPLAALSYKQGKAAWREAETLAERLDLPFLAITGVDQPEYWTATLAACETPCAHSLPLALHQLLHTTAAETQARVALTGLGARYLLSTAPHAFTAERVAGSELLRLYARSQDAQRASAARPAIWSREAARQIARATPWEETPHARRLARRAAQFAQPWQRWRYLELHLRLPDLLVNTAQQLAAVERIAVRSPYLDADMLERMARLPAVQEDDSPAATVFARLLSHHNIPLYEAPPLEAPVRSLLQRDASELLRQALSPAELRQTGLFDLQAVEALLRSPQPEAPRELLLVFTTQLLSKLFQASL